MGDVHRYANSISPRQCHALIDAFDRNAGLAQGSGIFKDRVLWTSRLDPVKFIEARRIVRASRYFAAYATTQSYHLVDPIDDDGPQLVKWPTGTCMPIHADEHHLDNPGAAHGTPWREFACVYYLNDDYEGGELTFPSPDPHGAPAIIKPRLGELVVFRGELPHGVAPITSGTRYTMPLWLTRERLHWREPLR